jgi:hypothetical protein
MIRKRKQETIVSSKNVAPYVCASNKHRENISRAEKIVN